ncbi:hypothetical protein PN499_12085 [Kamptonema animale CS-326]|uniref:hypothetical protein n=1 Tax=Kamptonema animale TaxID=92934 RepID=UPI00233042D5|nr:hypothetical protein [Kamptonema animale]MDB9511926.1 hypothetical protein [Kamptonema animale CS-326]
MQQKSLRDTEIGFTLRADQQGAGDRGQKAEGRGNHSRRQKVEAIVAGGRSRGDRSRR